MPERIWSEIRIDHFDELNQLYYVDAWLTDDDNEEGEVIARIYPATGYVEYVDERFTSVLAHQAMLDGGLKKKDRQRKELVDEISATIILQSYMDSRKFKL